MKARFSRHVFPGETIVVEAWIDHSQQCRHKKLFAAADFVMFRCRVSERNNEVVLDGGLAEIEDPKPSKEAKL